MREIVKLVLSVALGFTLVLGVAELANSQSGPMAGTFTQSKPATIDYMKEVAKRVYEGNEEADMVWVATFKCEDLSIERQGPKRFAVLIYFPGQETEFLFLEESFKMEDAQKALDAHWGKHDWSAMKHLPITLNPYKWCR